MSMTWKQFKEDLESQGVTDEMNVNWMAFGYMCGFPDKLYVEITDSGFSVGE